MMQKEETINLISDTTTLPSIKMKEAMMNAPLGDDVFREDPTVNALEKKVAKMFGKESALFCPSGTMTNQIAVKTHTQALDEVICDIDSHVYMYETGGYSFNSGVAINLIQGKHGKISIKDISGAIRPKFDWFPNSKLVVIENSCNRGGGSYYTFKEMEVISHFCKKKRLKLHLDGARIFNVLVETNDSTKEIGPLFDSISICISKGLGAPVGSLLIGDEDFIAQARRYRKVMGGGMRQSGILAAACIFALDNNISRLVIDNERARILGESLDDLNYVKSVRPVQTNIVIFDLKKEDSAGKFIKLLQKNGIKASAFGPSTIRFVTHLGFTGEMLNQTIRTLESLEDDLTL
jgi:threonine aldolase